MSQCSPLPTLLSLDASQRSLLMEWVQLRTMRVRLRERARIILAVADGASYRTVAAELGTSRDRVALWCARFREGGIEALTKERSRSRARSANVGSAVELVETTAQMVPEDAMPPSELGLAQFADSLEAIVGLYLSPSEHTMVLCCGRKHQARLADDMQPELSRPTNRRTTTATKEARRNITQLLAGLRMLAENVVEDPNAAHRGHVEWLGFLRWVHRLTPPDKVLHLICDSHATYSRPNVRVWLKKHPRVRIHFTPMAGSWLQGIDRFFRGFANRGLSRGVVQSIHELVTSIPDYVIDNGVRSKPFVWTAKANDMS